MKTYLVPMLLGSVLISGCQKTTSANVCDGWARLTPSLTTVVTIAQTDRPFADQVASHNRFGSQQKCW